MRPEDTAALVLAAGLSSRMGEFKPLLPVKGGRIIERIIGSFRSAGIERILVVVGHQAEIIVPVIQSAGAGWVINPDYREEMFSSVRVGATHLGGSVKAFFLVPADIPFFRPRTLTRLISAFDLENMDILRPVHFGRRGHPVLVAGSRIPSIEAYDGQGGLRALVKEQGWRAFELDVQDPGILIDLDTPGDYQKALAGPEGRPRRTRTDKKSQKK